MKIILFSRFHPFIQLLILIALIIAGFCIASFIMIIIGLIIFGEGYWNVISSLSNNSPEDVRIFLKWMQGFLQISMMLIPSLVFIKFYDNELFKIQRNNKIGNNWRISLPIILPFIVLPSVVLLNDWNNAIIFPDFLYFLEQYLRNLENTAAEMTKIILHAKTGWGLLLNLIIIAVIPAISEEFLFRGALQNLLKRWFKNVHWAVIVAALIFSAVHGQFFGFLPRFALGLMLGYLFVTINSIWAPITAHFVNNGTATVVAFLESKGIIETTAEEFGTMNNSELWGFISMTLTIMIFYLLWKRNKREEV